MVAMVVMEQTAESKRFAEIFESENWTQAGLASELGYKDSSIISLYLNGSRKIAESFLYKLESRYGWSARWIRTGKGDRVVTSRNHTQSNIRLTDSEGVFIQGDNNTVQAENERLKKELEAERLKRMELQDELIRLLKQGK